MKSLIVAIQMKATERYFPVILFILYKVVLTLFFFLVFFLLLLLFSFFFIFFVLFISFNTDPI